MPLIRSPLMPLLLRSVQRFHDESDRSDRPLTRALNLSFSLHEVVFVSRILGWESGGWTQIRRVNDSRQRVRLLANGQNGENSTRNWNFRYWIGKFEEIGGEASERGRRNGHGTAYCAVFASKRQPSTGQHFWLFISFRICDQPDVTVLAEKD